ncbi:MULTISPECIES: hypothetical protein [Cyanophyceae]|uniref:hypothetical protein n=1 Tax=Cyanophyceae TaxID=3028117 RepID=UPI001688AE0B|nr:MULTISPECIES: hypothetical protein [Cyanophyceae]MBD1916926.1 hypothetical protein [Phormidium sp. FACHB-77]MBD2029932.1 hypothetical protein [Phormidium sp. FACHB-322]MBD2053127.1 hypothetical protein [Leptolyngbya sp. FACHB-60]
MPQTAIDGRRKAYFKLSSEIARLDNAQLLDVFKNNATNTANSGWGTNQTLTFGTSQVFAKRIPVTDLEYKNLFSTKNLYNLPTYFNYGLGSTGLGVFRELVTHIKTTQWVLDGEIATFPLMYHYRIVPFSGPRSPVDQAQLNGYVNDWGNREEVRQYCLDRAIATHELVLFLEYIPYVLGEWLPNNPHKLQTHLYGLRTTIDFLRSKGIIHFDAHFFNAVTDGERAYLTDFGLALDQSFALTRHEESFFEQHKLYDYGEILRNLGFLMRSAYNARPESDRLRIAQKYLVEPDLKPYEITAIMLDNIQKIQADGDIDLDDFYVESVIKYRRIIALMQNFFADMVENSQKDTAFPHIELEHLLKETGYLA